MLIPIVIGVAFLALVFGLVGGFGYPALAVNIFGLSRLKGRLKGAFMSRSALPVLFALIALLPVGVDDALAAAPPRNPNSHLYSTRNPSAITGRSGSAALTVRTLIGKDNQTSIELSTGQLDSGATPPGNISKVQIKAYDAAGEVAFAHNYNDLASGGYLAYNYSTLHRGETLQVQANIRGIDRKRTDVVSVTAVVKARPDIAVESVFAPGMAYVNTPVNIVATVRELNGDAGARLNCLLYVNEVVVDRIEGMYVDGGGTVSCAFTHEFDTTGTKQLRVEAAGVVPGDWDGTNNTASTSVVIESPVPAYNWASASVYDVDFDNYYRSWGGYSYQDPYDSSSSGADWSYVNSWTGWEQGFWYYGVLSSKRTSFPVVALAPSVRVDGEMLVSATYSNVAAVYGYGDENWGLNCGFLTDALADRTIYTQVCTQWWSPAETAAMTWVNLSSYAGEVTYFSERYEKYWFKPPQGELIVQEYTWTWNQTSGVGRRLPIGNTYVLDVSLTDGSVTYSLPLTVSPAPFTYSYGTPLTCYSYGDVTYTDYSYSCWEEKFSRKGVQGYAWGP
jgi:hypothetical protein